MIFIDNIKKLYKRSIALQKKNIEFSRLASRKADEVLWANIYNQTIADREWLKRLSLSPGRWSASYSLLFLIVRILTDYRPGKILELGLGESSKLISTFLQNSLHESEHHIIEHDDAWIENFNKRFQLTDQSKVMKAQLGKRLVEGEEVISYVGLDPESLSHYDFFLIDAPYGSPRYSRHEICDIIKFFPKDKSFIIILDDVDREGEQDTADVMEEILKSKDISFFSEVYKGEKSHLVIASADLKFFTTL